MRVAQIEKGTNLFDNLPQGIVFEVYVNGSINTYMKLESHASCKLNAVDLENGRLTYFSPDIFVIPYYDATVVKEGYE